ncbi:acyltransferase [Pedobacter metabolipauper]|uniref:Acetyltransferase-like isoleucine patch superfamily enzyme n=1 Tax=Pedobacter metabolipauper TaxID=425513 RepID=A0A4R6SWY6_9SPHI|nr:DapH/DapD/GlmU-related protein [Pedobacter metabolipauper]TDQ09926.1 acetyltransferase-like isoleucine patch superfamily enzyme [Pedobacter metabolipauper]
MLKLTQYFLRSFRPLLNSWITRFVYFGSNVTIGENFRTDSIPKIIIDPACQLHIGDHVEFRRSVEIRVHGTAQIFIGNKTRIDRGVRLLAANSAKIDIKDGVRIGLYSVLNGGDSITIGNKALVSGFVYLQTSMHGYASKDQAVQDQGYDHAPVVLEEDVWLGTHVVVLPGITIGKGSVVGSNAVVTKNIEQYQVVAGIPAKPLKDRK